MKKIIQSKIFLIISGIIFTSIGVYAANYIASDVSYTPSNKDWKVNNVNDALDELYIKQSNLTNIEELVLADVYGNSIGITESSGTLNGSVNQGMSGLNGAFNKVYIHPHVRGKTGTLEVTIDGVTTTYTVPIDYPDYSNEYVIDITGANSVNWKLSGKQNSTNSYYIRLLNAKFTKE